MPKDDFLAVAYTDLNGNHKYNPSKDALIAALVDTNNDNEVSIGDNILWGTYPEIPDGSASGTGGQYTSLVTEIIAVDYVNDFAVQVVTALGKVVWFASPNQEEFLTFHPLAGAVESHLIDSINQPAIDDAIYADPNTFGPGAPNFTIDISDDQLGDQGFLDVFNGWVV